MISNKHERSAPNPVWSWASTECQRLKEDLTASAPHSLHRQAWPDTRGMRLDAGDELKSDRVRAVG